MSVVAANVVGCLVVSVCSDASVRAWTLTNAAALDVVRSYDCVVDPMIVWSAVSPGLLL